MKTPRFSRVGEMPTAEELELLKLSDDAWARLGRRIGPEALMVLLEELGGLRPHVPDRADFFRRLFRPLRDRMVLDALGTGVPQGEVARRLRMSQAQVSRIKHRKHRRTAGNNGA